MLVMTMPVRHGGAHDHLVAAAGAESIDIAIIASNFLVNEIRDDTDLSGFSANDWISTLARHDIKRFQILSAIVMRSQRIREIFGAAEVSWDALWDWSSPNDAALIAKTLQCRPQSILQHPLIEYKLSRHRMAIVYAVYEVLELLDTIDFVFLFSRLHVEAIEIVRSRGHLDNTFSDASVWIRCLAQEDQSWPVELFQYMKATGAFL